jgi:hypothetical protein
VLLEEATLRRLLALTHRNIMIITKKMTEARVQHS